MSEAVLLVISNLPDEAAAATLAAELVQRHAAACVNILAPCRSVYRWQGAVESGTEVPVLIKTTAERYALVEKIVLETHPYEVPEIIAVPLTNGLPAYLQWVAVETRLEQAD